jgi:hypothetical protein
MAQKTTYYAVIDSRSSRERPRTVVRRTESDDSQSDEIFSRDLAWETSPLLRGAERGDTMLDFVSIAEDEAIRIVDRIRAEARPDD